MPRIKIYDQQIRTPEQLNSVDPSPQVASQVGRSYAELGGQISRAGDVAARVQEQTEISEGTVKMAEAQTTFSKRLNDDLQKGEFDSEKFLQDYDEHLSKIGEGFGTRGAQTFLQKAGASAKSHFSDSAFAATRELRSVKTKENYANTRKNWTSSLMNDPSSYQAIQEQHNAYIETLVATQGLDAKTAAQFRVEGETDIAKSAIRGWIALNPEDAKAQLDAKKWDSKIDGDVKKQLLGEADMNIRANRADLERQEREAEKALVERQKGIQNDFLNKMISGKLSAREIVQSDLEPTGGGSKTQFLEMLEQHNKKGSKFVTDKGVFVDLYKKIHLQDGDPEKLVDETLLNPYLGNGLTIGDIGKLRKEIQGIGTGAGKEISTMKRNLMTIAKGKLTKSNPLIGFKDPDGDAQYADFTSHFMDEYEAQIAAGKSPKALLTPSSPDYMGHSIEAYVKTPQQIMKANIDRMKKPKAPVDPTKARLPGETIEQWKTRTKTAAK